ncbi:hypothetical protein QTQ03_08685 [Micromonospora sp. WMMA1363]|uniref:hypothetical protein n=1 Tax=Micromonospora sp. WMMA1363 TaxID=3053985 RepID=UPI00259D02AC|nr:hypothetical protein [Micromonospora sp. WMMA1363]MDM4719653.1 hypothetical protein [Micromonospora sp. WMMA1363]
MLDMRKLIAHGGLAGSVALPAEERLRGNHRAGDAAMPLRDAEPHSTSKTASTPSANR